MARVASVQKNLKRKSAIDRMKTKRHSIKEKVYDKSLTLEERFEYVLKLSKMPRDSSKSRFRNRCALTGRPRGFCRKVGVSRNSLRELAAIGLLPGVVKASW